MLSGRRGSRTDQEKMVLDTDKEKQRKFVASVEAEGEDKIHLKHTLEERNNIDNVGEAE